MVDDAAVLGPEALVQVRRFFFPQGEDTARGVRGVRTVQRGEMRMSPEARWIPFAAEEFTDATSSNFRWEARLDPEKLVSPTVTDAYENGRGQVVVKLWGILPARKITGPEADKGELQRYLASFVFCPPMLLRHAGLDCRITNSARFELCDRQDATGASVEFELSEAGKPIALHALRPRISGRTVLETPWLGTVSEFKEFNGIRVATRLEVAWALVEGIFPYYRAEITRWEALR